MKASFGWERRLQRCKSARYRMGDEPIAPYDAEFVLRAFSEIINNRLVALLAFNEFLSQPFLMAELEGELERIATIRLSPHGHRMKARTIYRLLAVRNFRGSVRGRASVRLNLWAEDFTRNRRSIAEIDRLAMDFYRQAAVLLSRGEAPIHLLEPLHLDERKNQQSKSQGVDPAVNRARSPGHAVNGGPAT